MMGLTTVMLCDMADLREAVSAELVRRGWSRYTLVQELKKKGIAVSPATVYAFLSGSRAIGSTDLGKIMGVLGLVVKRKR